MQPVAEQWLVSFNDPVLSALVDEAVAPNADLRIAAARVEQAAGYVKLAGATLYPAVGVLAHGGGKAGGDGGLQGIWLNASLELDVWGRVRYGQAAAQAQFASADADYAYARQSLAAGVAKSYFLAVEASLQRSIALESLRASDEMLRLVGERLRIGVGDEQASCRARRESWRLPRHAAAGRVFTRPGAAGARALVGRYPATEVASRSSWRLMPSSSVCRRSSSSGGRTSSPPSGASLRRSTASRRPRPRCFHGSA